MRMKETATTTDDNHNHNGHCSGGIQREDGQICQRGRKILITTPRYFNCQSKTTSYDLKATNYTTGFPMSHKLPYRPVLFTENAI